MNNPKLCANCAPAVAGLESKGLSNLAEVTRHYCESGHAGRCEKCETNGDHYCPADVETGEVARRPFSWAPDEDVESLRAEVEMMNERYR